VGFYNLEHQPPGEPFGFRVQRPVPAGIEDRYDLDDFEEDTTVPADCWSLGLPHQCDSWAIAMSPDREAVLAEARRFRAELDAAIAQLEAGSGT
jgi:hypothetical protein